MPRDKRRILIAAAVLVAAALAAGLFLWRRGAGDHEGGGAAPVAPAASPTAKRMSSNESGGSGDLPTSAPVEMEDDPVGSLRLEGQVVGTDDQPVGDATVTLSASPGRSATTEKDGSFAFDKLIGRSYTLEARKGELVGGPVMITLREATEPVVIDVAQGVTIEVTVVAEGSGKPVSGASVAADDDITGTTDDKGVALLKGVGRGSWAAVSARASGFAAGRTLVMVPDAPGAVAPARIELRRGAAVSGVVVSEDGQPIAGARVAARDTSQPFDLSSLGDQATTDAGGKFTLPSVAAGTYRLVATHPDHAPGSSEALPLDGSSPRNDVKITLAAGGVAAGKVVDASGAAVPWATVRIGAALTGAMTATDVVTHQVSATQDGSFEVKGLPRRALIALALSEQASSAAIPVDLASQAERRDLLLRLDGSGTIAGIVVDDAGEPVVEAQVTAYPGIFDGPIGEDFALRGPAAEATDGAGRFVLRGLRPGTYRLFPGRGGSAMLTFTREGTKAKTGDKDVRVVLHADGAIAGRVEFAGGGAPEVFTVAIGWTHRLPVASGDGRFQLPSVPPGKHDVTIRGPEFAETTLPDVEVAAGQTKDVGTVKVKRGRNVSGRVVGPNGRPVAGATVILGKQLFGDGNALASASMASFEDALGVRRTTSDADGDYVVRGIGDKPMMIAAEHEAQGRSSAQVVPAGTTSATVDLVLAGVGGVSGRVRAGGKPAGGVIVIAAAAASGVKQQSMVTTGDDGLYQFTRLAAGPYKVTAMIGTGLGGSMASRPVKIVANQKATLDIDIAVGEISLTVTVKPATGSIDSAQIFLFDGAVSVNTAEQLNEQMGQGGGAKMLVWMGGAPMTFEKVTPGKKSICVIPITGNLADSSFQQRLQENLGKLKSYCSPFEVAPSPQAQATTVTVPPMEPLPPPTP